MFVAEGTSHSNEQILSDITSRLGKRSLALNRNGNEWILSNLARLAGLAKVAGLISTPTPISNIGINFELKGVSGV